MLWRNTDFSCHAARRGAPTTARGRVRWAVTISTVLVLPATKYLIVLLFFCIVHFGNGENFFTWCNFSVMLTKQITGLCTTAVLVSICEQWWAQRRCSPASATSGATFSVAAAPLLFFVTNKKRQRRCFFSRKSGSAQRCFLSKFSAAAAPANKLLPRLFQLTFSHVIVWSLYSPFLFSKFSLCSCYLVISV